MGDIDKVILFNSIFLVLWTVWALPELVERKQTGLIVAVFVVIFLIEAYLYSAIHDFPFDILGGLLMVGLSLGGGLLMHRYNKRKRQEEKA